MSDKNITKAQLRAKQFYESVIEQFPHSMAIYDSKGYFVKGNSAYYVLFNAPPTPDYSVFDESNPLNARPGEFISIIGSGKPARLQEIWHNPHDVNPERPDIKLCLDIRSYPLVNPDGEIEFTVLVHQDITERKNAELALKESEMRYRAVVEDQTEFIIRYLPGGKMTFVNEALCRLVNLDREELLGNSFLDYIPEDDKNIFDEMFHSITVENPAVTTEHRSILPDGGICWMQWTNRGIFDDDGKLIVYQAVGRDITDLKSVEGALRESENKYRDLVENITDVIYTTDEKGRLTYVSPVVETAYGYKQSEMIGRHFTEFVIKEDIPGITAVFKERLEGVLGSFEARYITKSGEIRWFLGSSRPITEDGRIKGIRGVLKDVTEQKEAEEKLRQASRMEATATLAAGIAHDFNNLMVGVLGNAELLKVELGELSPAHDRLAGISKAAQQAGDLAQQMLAFARGGKYQPRVVNFNEIILDNLALHESLIRPGIHVVRNLDESLSNIKGDATQLDQVILNLCKNAVESIEGKGTITITTRDMELDERFTSTRPGLSPGSYIYVSVEDSGSGIDKDVLANIFEPFFTTKSKGRGLGLAAAYGIIKNHGGVITVQSEPGHGAIFKIYLPSTDADIEKPVKMEDLVPEGNETILIIDDDESVVDVTERILLRLGYKVLRAYNGLEAVELARDYEGDIHLALLDMGMPVMDGSEAFPLLRKERPDMKILICSGYEQDAASNKLIDGGASGFIQKPFMMKLLGREIRKVLDE